MAHTNEGFPEHTPYSHPAAPASPAWLESLRLLTGRERETLVDSGSVAENWDQIMVADGFDPFLVRNCTFSGSVIIGPLNRGSAGDSTITLPIGIYDSTIIDTIAGKDVSISSVYCSRYILGDGVIIRNVGELITTPDANFGNGAATDGSDDHRFMNLINENGGRAVIPFEGMLPSDAYLWAKYRNDAELMKKLTTITVAFCERLSGSYGIIGLQSTVRNVKILQNARVGTHARIEGAERVANVTVHSDEQEPSTIGFGVQLQDSIIGYGNTIESGSQAASVVTGTNVRLSRCARISHTFVGDSSLIACGEIANSLLYPSHGQHHNSSFLIASMIGGQSNIAAGATIGSNHTSRVNDGELWAGRGFWPGLCSSFKHNSKFASFTLAVKADYPHELNIPFPFSLVMNDPLHDTLVIVPAYWFTNNMYAFSRSCQKFAKRDHRKHREQTVEHEVLAPDTIEEMFSAIEQIEIVVGRAWLLREHRERTAEEMLCRNEGHALLATRPEVVKELAVKGVGFERSSRSTVLRNCLEGWQAYRKMIIYYCVKVLLRDSPRTSSIIPSPVPQIRTTRWINFGGSIIREEDVNAFIAQIKNDREIKTWNDIHALYKADEAGYSDLSRAHAFASLAAIERIEPSLLTEEHLKSFLEEAIPVCEWVAESTVLSRQRDYSDPFRKMVYDSTDEMNAVLGEFTNDPVVRQVKAETTVLVGRIGEYVKYREDPPRP